MGLGQAFPATPVPAAARDEQSARELNCLPANIQSQQGQMCGIAGMHRAWGEEAAKSHPLASPLPRMSSICFHSVGG